MTDKNVWIKNLKNISLNLSKYDNKSKKYDWINIYRLEQNREVLVESFEK